MIIVRITIAIVAVIIGITGAIAMWLLERKIKDRQRRKPIRLKHSSLRRVGDSMFKSECPKCREGTLPVTRDQKTLKVIAEDYCLLCGQRFIYTDFERIAD